ncbi:Glycosyl transferases group 1 [Lishizhenia tianjinensis]|uniref:Glycosyl transferases group 1 n=1 Tax=Lishizhenia tianjinensis TaxID=477690 RepID=A0A1I7BAW5_9FLAO|nr:glycosyltransferase [Lishizhenia tianjinensis]SFT84360.1 Glycosyl transferases group 1 [Lishizhenia tianjinensis]
MKPKIHIVSFDVPYPADYGGVIDVYYRCKALTDFGYEVVLHCFDYGRGRPKELLEVVSEVHYYKRKSTILSLFSRQPMIVFSRKNKDLLNNLKKDDAPVIFEGQHCTAFIDHPDLKSRIKFIRCHNVESDYYHQLAEVENSLFKKIFFQIEARKLGRQEELFHFADGLFSVSEKDQKYFVNKYGNSEFLAVANPLSSGKYIPQKKKYILMHGNLSVMENEHAVRWVLEHVIHLVDHKLIVAGKNPNDEFLLLLKNHPQVEVHISPSNEILTQLIAEAQVNLLITFQATGIKHKLINALSNGGHIIANTPMLEGTKMDEFCSIANTPEEIKTQIETCFSKAIDLESIEERRSYLSAHYGLMAHAQQINEAIAKKKKRD